MTNQKILFFCSMAIFGFMEIKAQNFNEISYDSLVKIYDSVRNDTLKAKAAARAYLDKGRTTNDSTRMARGYARLATMSQYEEALLFLDSAIVCAKNSKHPDYPATLFLSKGRLYYYGNEYEKSLNNTIMGYNAAKDKKNVVNEMVGLRGISITNSLWGEHRKSLEAKFSTLELLEKHKELPQIKEIYSMAYISTLSGVGTSYEKLGLPDSALYYYKRGIEIALKVKDSANYFDIVERSGAALYDKGELKAARDSLDKGFNNKKIVIDYSTYPFYVGSIYFKQGDEKQGIEIFRKIDSTYKKDEVLYPELAQVYKTLANYYKQQNDEHLQLQYLNDLFLVDSLVKHNNRYVKDMTVQDYEIPLLLKEKNELVLALKEKEKFSNTKITWVLIFLGISLLALGYYFRKQRTYKKRFERLIKQQEERITKEAVPIKEKGKSYLTRDTVIHILNSLEQFEKEKGYLRQDLTLQLLAKEVGTNTNYLSKVINAEMSVNFAHYLSDLRIAHCAKRLRKDSKFRKYTIKAISEESGFGTSESFSKIFYKKYGIYPSYYIKQLQST